MTISDEQYDFIASRLQDEYCITVQFTRYLSEDWDHSKRHPVRFDKGLIIQLVKEIQEAQDMYGLPAGRFSVESIKFSSQEEYPADYLLTVWNNDDGSFDLDLV